MSNHTAKKGQVYVCGACGKQSRDKYGDDAISKGWDVSCMMNSVLVKEDSVKLDEHGLVTACEVV